MKILALAMLLLMSQNILAAEADEYEYADVMVTVTFPYCQKTREEAEKAARTKAQNAAADKCVKLGSGWARQKLALSGHVSIRVCPKGDPRSTSFTGVEQYEATILDDTHTCRRWNQEKAQAKRDAKNKEARDKADREKADREARQKEDTARREREKAEASKKTTGKPTEAKRIDDAFVRMEKETAKPSAGKGNSIDAAFAELDASRKVGDGRQKKTDERGKGESVAEVKPKEPPKPKALTAGTVFKDCNECPDMVVLPPEAGNLAMGRTEVTQAQYRAVMGNNPSKFAGCDDCPADSVSWNDAREFVERLSRKTGKSYRLPAEAEWEKACRAGSQDTYCGGNDADSLAWYDRNSGNKTHPVAQKRANAWGLYDMSGNVFEWTEECWKGDCAKHVVRGGSWYYGTGGLRADFRSNNDVGDRNINVGFRVARSLP